MAPKIFLGVPILNGLGLFEGIGGISIALRDYVHTAAFCESDPYAQCVLLKQFPGIPIWDDVRTLNHLPFQPDIIYGGFPCQDISVAGHGKGLEGKRSGLFFEMLRIIEEQKPAFIFLENVPAIRTRGAERVCKELAAIRYDCRWGVVSAEEVGASHKRKRWFLLAHAQGIGSGKGTSKESGPSGENTLVGAGRWKTEPDVGRVVDGFPGRVDRIRCLGNAVVPVQAKEAFERLMGLK